MTTQNLFAYCGNNPVNNTDTSGHIFAGAVIGGIIGGIFGGLGALAQGESVFVGAATGALVGIGIGLIPANITLRLAVAVTGIASGAGNFFNQVGNNYAENLQASVQSSSAESGENSISFTENIAQSVADVDYGEVASATVIGMAFAPLSYGSNYIVKDAFKEMGESVTKSMAENIVGTIFEFNVSAIQFVVDLF